MERSFKESTSVESSISLSGSVRQFQLQRWIKLIRHKQMIHLTEASSHERDSSSKNNSELRFVEADFFPAEGSQFQEIKGLLKRDQSFEKPAILVSLAS